MHTRSRTLSVLSLTALLAVGAAGSAQAAPRQASPLKRIAPTLNTLRDTGNALGVTLKTAGESAGRTAKSLGDGTATRESVTAGTNRTVASLFGTVAVAVGGVSKTVGAVSGKDCGQDLSQPFAQWDDVADYTLVPGGDFEGDVPQWLVAGGAGIVDDQEPWRVTAPTDKQALGLPAGGSALSLPMCAGLTHPTLRLFVRGTGTLRIDGVYPDTEGVLRTATLGTVTPTADWQPTFQMLTLSGLPLLSGESLSLRLTAAGGPVTVDDIYVDPVRRR